MSHQNDEGRPLQQGGPVDQLAAQLAEHHEPTPARPQHPGATTDGIQAHAEAFRVGRLILQPRDDHEARMGADLGRHGFAGLRRLARTHDLIANYIDGQEQSR